MNRFRVEIGSSLRLRALLALAHGMGAYSCWLAIGNPYLLAAVLTALGGSAVWHDRRQCHPPVSVFEADADGCRVLWRGRWLDARVQEALVTELLTVVNLLCAGRRLDLVLLADNADAEAVRQLRVWLRWRGGF